MWQWVLHSTVAHHPQGSRLKLGFCSLYMWNLHVLSIYYIQSIHILLIHTVNRHTAKLTVVPIFYECICLLALFHCHHEPSHTHADLTYLTSRAERVTNGSWTCHHHLIGRNAWRQDKTGDLRHYALSEGNKGIGYSIYYSLLHWTLRCIPNNSEPEHFQPPNKKKCYTTDEQNGYVMQISASRF